MADAISARGGALAAFLAAIVCALALALCAQAGARAHSATCTRSPSGHAGHGAHVCKGNAGKAGNRRGKSRHSKAGGHRPKHTASPHTPAKGGQAEEGSGGSGQAGAPGGREALCEDGSAPGAVEEGENGNEETFVCEDGSEPACAQGFAPVVSGDGLQLLCEAATGSEQRSS